MKCAHTKVDFRDIPMLLDVHGNCKRCEAAFDDHQEAPDELLPTPDTITKVSLIVYLYPIVC